MTAPAVSRRPTRLSSVLAVAMGVATVWLLFDVSGFRTALLFEVVGLAVFGVGAELRANGWSWTGLAVALAGLAVVPVAMLLGVQRLPGSGSVIQAVPGLLGVAVLALGVFPLRDEDGSRRLVKAGAAFLFVNVLVGGIFQVAPLGTMLAAGAATVLAWDAGEQAINVSEHLGRAGRTWTVETAHAGGTLFAGGVAVLAGQSVGDLGGSLTLAQFALLVVAVILLTVALHD
ncbi:hypothetical protein ACFQH6_15970 [Halobacteriaceae archaeon GCM10025711]